MANTFSQAVAQRIGYDRLLITGASGFIGQHCLKHLNAERWDVHCVCRKTSQNQLKALEQSVEPTIHTLDLHDLPKLTHLISELRPTHLLHLAHEARPGYFWEAAENIEWIHTSIHLVQQFYANGGQRCVAVGSCAEYAAGASACIVGATPTLPGTTYGLAKLSIFSALSAVARLAKKPFAWVRLFHLYGPGGAIEKVPGLFIDRLIRQMTVRCESPQRAVDFLHVSDAARALTMLLDAEFQGAINVASGTGTELGAVAKIIAKELQSEHLLDLNIQSTASDRLVADVAPLRDNIGFEPRFSLEEGLRQTISWHRHINSSKHP